MYKRSLADIRAGHTKMVLFMHFYSTQFSMLIGDKIYDVIWDLA